MYYIDSVPRNYGPKNRILLRLPEIASHVKMDDQESAFICGLLEKCRPEKILEAGIANGGTSAIIMECMHGLGSSYELHCVDRIEKGCGGSDREIGFLGKEASKSIRRINCPERLLIF